jgi:hypothetical protein
MQEEATFQLVMGRGPQPGQVFEFPRATISIGRDPGNDVVINDRQISRQHARVTPQGGLLILEDLASTNGTTVNGMLIRSAHALAHGDEIGLGENVTLIFYGRPAGDAGDTVAAPRSTYAPPEPEYPSGPARIYEAEPYEQEGYAAYPTYESYAPAYAEAADYGTYEDAYEEYEQEGGRNWALIGVGCLLVAIIVGLLLAIYIYFLAPSSIVDPIIDFLAGLGLDVP